MIKVILETLTPSREPLPSNLRGLNTHTLQNLQTELNPVPDDLTGIEYWPEIKVTPEFDPMTEKLEGEILTANAGDKTVTVEAIVVDLSPEEIATIAANAESQAIKTYGDAVQAHLDAEARSHVYDGILSLCTYASSPSAKFYTEGQLGVEWRDACWTYTYAQLDAVKAGEREAPTPAELVAELPAMAWPA